MADDVGREVLGSYGGTSYPTPRLDALAESGIRFTHAFSMAVCHPTRVTLLTGKYPFRLGHPKWGTFPKEYETKTIAHALKSAGYATAVAGKWQLTLQRDDPNQPERLGFDESCVFGWHEGARYHDPYIWQNGKLREGLEGTYGPDVYADFLIDFMKRNRERPFFAYFPMALCHDVTDDLPEPVPYGPGKNRYDSYPEMVANMDRVVGRLVDALDELGLRENTLVLFYTDNGTPSRVISRALGGRKFEKEPVISRLDGRDVPGGKGKLTDWGTRVPLIASQPGRVPSGKTTEALVDASDFYTTLAALAGLPSPPSKALDGESFASVLHNPTASGDRAWAFAEHKGRAFVRDHRWKIYSDGRVFDVKKDVNEATAITPEEPEVATLREALRQLDYASASR